VHLAPRRNELHEQPNSERSQNPVRPKHLRATACGTVHLRLKRKTAIINDSHAAKTSNNS